MSDINNSTSLNKKNFKDAKTSIADSPNRITTPTSTVAVRKIVGRNNSISLNRQNNIPVKKKSNSRDTTSTDAKSLNVRKFGKKYPQLHLDLSDFGASDSSELSITTKSTCKSIDKSSLGKMKIKPCCETNIFKVEKKNLCTSNRKTGMSVLDKVKQSTKLSIKQEVNQTTKLSIKQKVNQTTKLPIKKKINHLPDQTNIKPAVAGTTLKKNKRKNILDAAIKASRTLGKSRTTALDLSSLDWKRNRGICSSASLALLDRNINVQDKFKLKVRKPKTKMEYLSRNCKFLYLTEPEMEKPLLVLDFDSLLIPFTLPSEDLSKHKQEISRFIHTMYSHVNIAVWSATSMKMLVSRLKDLGVFDEDQISKITFCLDSTSTTTAFVPGLGNTIVKSLEVIGNLYPQFDKNNTIMMNKDLKKYVWQQYGVPVGTQENQKLIKYYELVTISNFLTNMIKSARSFFNLNIQSWKESWN